MNWRKSTVAGIFVFLLMLLSSMVVANPSIPHTDPGAAGLPNNGNIIVDENWINLEFSSEYVMVIVDSITDEGGWLNATYSITNTGNNSISQTIALPGYDLIANINQSTIKVDGITVDWWYHYDIYINNHVSNADSDDYVAALFNVTFAPMQTRTISLESPISFLFLGWDPLTNPGNLSLEYIVTTGNSWGGWQSTIGQADIIFNISSSFINEISIIEPGGYLFENNTDWTIIHWKYANWTPEQEIRFSWIPDNWPSDVIVENHGVYAGVNSSVIFNVSNDCSLGYGYLYYYQIDYGDGVISDWENTTFFTHTYTEPGTYTVQIYGKDSKYWVVSEPVSVVINVEMEPVPDNNFILIFIGILLALIVSGVLIMATRMSGT